MKKFLVILIALLLIMGIVAECIAENSNTIEAFNSLLEGATDQEISEMLELINAEIEARRIGDSEVEPTEATNAEYVTDFGTFAVQYFSAKRGSVGEKNYLVCGFAWANNGSKAAMFASTVSAKAYQNGVALKTGFIAGLDTKEMTSVLPGYSSDVYTVYELSNTTDSVLLQIKPMFDLMEQYSPLEVTIDLADIE